MQKYLNGLKLHYFRENYVLDGDKASAEGRYIQFLH